MNSFFGRRCPNEGKPCYCTGACKEQYTFRFWDRGKGLPLEVKKSEPDEKPLILYIVPAIKIYEQNPLPNHKATHEAITEEVIKIAKQLQKADGQ